MIIVSFGFRPWPDVSISATCYESSTANDPSASGGRVEGLAAVVTGTYFWEPMEQLVHQPMSRVPSAPGCPEYPSGPFTLRTLGTGGSGVTLAWLRVFDTMGFCSPCCPCESRSEASDCVCVPTNPTVTAGS
ncbi:hypothetical protein DP939_25800 [Spongiactinospora rosea]|uniref:Uncharacterized protein n=1 Tax=Spongiactinospora rosea TaxID=2248750 RepID=A0A366LUT0_9ACTN|nr:hypothetical protein DP939_25800 [Spongiactinospora rosea]